MFYSTNHRSPLVSFKEALLRGLAPDGGLYMPEHLPEIELNDPVKLKSISYPDIAALITGYLTGNEIGREELLELCHDVYRFPVPLENIQGNKYIMRLDRGPTASFKDFAALLMARMMQHFLKKDNRHITILTATSGDTGSAVANAFYGLENIDVIILFPAGEVSLLQRKQMTTLQKNINVIAIDGKFDDCQRLVKRAFLDESLARLNLSSANSINIGRLIPQSVYYFWAWSRIAEKNTDKITFSVPCGNFGNVAGGILAREMGLPVKCFVISTNSNNEVPEYLRTGKYHIISPSVNCLSNAMNVGHPSNLARIISLYGGIMDENGYISIEPDLKRMQKDLFAVSVTDEETINTILQSYRELNVILEPHGAVAWNGLHKYIRQKQDIDDKNAFFVSLETAHPGKFREDMEKILGIRVDLPEVLSGLEDRQEEYQRLDNDYETLKNHFTSNY